MCPREKKHLIRVEWQHNNAAQKNLPQEVVRRPSGLYKVLGTDLAATADETLIIFMHLTY